jgi:multidrug efflux pump subunit AcrB
MITLFALIVVLGIVVDDGIVTGESIYDSQERNPDDKNSTLNGVLAIMPPVTIGVLTTMAAFAPLIFSTGTLGQIIGIIPVVVISILFVSLIEAYFILPSHLAVPKKWSHGFLADIRDFVSKNLKSFIAKMLTPAISFALKWRYATLAAFIAIIIITSGLVTSGKIRFIFFPNVESDKVTINIKMPLGTPFLATNQVLNEAERIVLNIKDKLNKDHEINTFESISVSIGESSGNSGGPGVFSTQSGGHIGQIKIKMVPSDFRNFSAFELENIIRPEIEKIPGIETLGFQSSLFGEEADIEIELTHPDEEKLSAATALLRKEIENIKGTKEVDDTFEDGKNEYVFRLNKKGLAAGLTPELLGSELRAAYFGIEATRFQRGRSEVVVYVRYPKIKREDAAMLTDTRIRLANGTEVPLNSVAEITKQRGYSQINTVNGRRVVSVTADVNSDVIVPNEVIKILQDKILPDLKNQYQGLNYSFEGESKDQKEDLASLGQNMLIALLIIYVLLGSQLRSYLQPFIIMSAIPFGVVGAILGHFVLGYDLTFISMFGIVALTGVLVNDSVVLIDYLNKIRHQCDSLKEAIIKSVQRRFRPILLTTLSTSFGLLPILLETSVQAQFLVPMVVSLSMGILFATFIILLLIPCLLLISEDVKKLFSKLFS